MKISYRQWKMELFVSGALFLSSGMLAFGGHVHAAEAETFSPQTQQEDELLIIGSDPQGVESLERQSVPRKRLRKRPKRHQDLLDSLKSSDIPEMGYLGCIAGTGTGLGGSATPLTPAEVEKDADRWLGDLQGGASSSPDPSHTWTKYGFYAKLCISQVIAIPVPSPVMPNVGAVVNMGTDYQLILKSQDHFETPAAFRNVLGEKIWDLLKPLGAVKFLRIPYQAEALIAKYPPGSEVITENDFGLRVVVGAHLGTPFIGADLNTFAIIQGRFRKHLKILADPDQPARPLVRYSVTNTKIRGGGLDAGVSLGVSLYQLPFTDFYLGANLVSFHIEKTKAHALLFDYTYDLSYPEARAALTAARHGDLRPSQKLGVFHDEMDRYRGIAINDEKVSDVITVASARAIGFLARGTGVHIIDIPSPINPIPQVNIGRFGEFFFIGSRRKRQDTVVEKTNFLREKATLVSYDFEHQRKRSVMLGLAHSTDRVVHARAQVITAEKKVDGQSVQTVTQPKLSFSYYSENKRKSDGIFNEYYSISERLLSWQDASAARDIKEERGPNDCDPRNGANFVVHGTLYGDAIRRALNYDEATLWPKFREFIQAGIQVSPSQARFAERRFKSFFKFFVPNWRAMRTAISDELRMKALRNLLSAYGSDLTAFEFFTALAIQDEHPEGVALSVSLAGDHCNHSWSRSGTLDASLDDVMKDW